MYRKISKFQILLQENICIQCFRWITYENESSYRHFLMKYRISYIDSFDSNTENDFKTVLIQYHQIGRKNNEQILLFAFVWQIWHSDHRRRIFLRDKNMIRDVYSYDSRHNMCMRLKRIWMSISNVCFLIFSLSSSSSKGTESRDHSSNPYKSTDILLLLHWCYSSNFQLTLSSIIDCACWQSVFSQFDERRKTRKKPQYTMSIFNYFYRLLD